MLGINGIEFVILLIIGVLVVGPERLPTYAAQLAQLVKDLRRMANGARDQLREEVGPEFDDVDWRKLDPRQYDPRRIIKEALTEELGGTLMGEPVSPGKHKPQSATLPSSAPAAEPAAGPPSGMTSPVAPEEPSPSGAAAPQEAPAPPRLDHASEVQGGAAVPASAVASDDADTDTTRTAPVLTAAERTSSIT